MEKETYIAPQMEVIEIDTVQMLASSKPEIGVGEDEKDAGQAWSNDRRGTWGNLWDDGNDK